MGRMHYLAALAFFSIFSRYISWPAGMNFW